MKINTWLNWFQAKFSTGMTDVLIEYVVHANPNVPGANRALGSE